MTVAPTFAGWQRHARSGLQQGFSPDEVHWQELAAEQPALDLFEESEAPDPKLEASFRVPKSFVPLAQTVALHRDERRWALLYRVLWRLTHGERKLLEIAVDEDVRTLAAMAKAVRHDIHKMRAFVRFREVRGEDGPWFIAWFEPAHYIVEANAKFFVDRFANMRWAILTPDRCAHWDGKQLAFTAGLTRSAAPEGDEMETLWRTYYANIFNPARVKVHAMQAEMPKKYWKNLPEAALIPALLNEAPRRVETMIRKSKTQMTDEAKFEAAPVPKTTSLEKLRKAAKGCRACPLWKTATQTVFGEGPRKARVLMIGEQPGDQEDLAGRPFVGPAGKLLDRALAEAGVDRDAVYVTNAVKHFKWEPRGKRRLHKKPNSREIAACRPWLEAELHIVQPEILVCLGATAAGTIFGPQIRVTKDRGEFLQTEFSQKSLITVHPSSLLRAPDEETRAREYAHFVADLKLIATALAQ
ncbi:MAG: uracil-DNA glycosylase [Chthoniobacter sp.]|jgi:DNA polymerase|nr:uracil-DNA glycosylase [Chthoniobacter sp.]